MMVWWKESYWHLWSSNILTWERQKFAWHFGQIFHFLDLKCVFWHPSTKHLLTVADSCRVRFTGGRVSISIAFLGLCTESNCSSSWRPSTSSSLRLFRFSTVFSVPTATSFIWFILSQGSDICFSLQCLTASARAKRALMVLRRWLRINNKKVTAF